MGSSQILFNWAFVQSLSTNFSPSFDIILCERSRTAALWLISFTFTLSFTPQFFELNNSQFSRNKFFSSNILLFVVQLEVIELRGEKKAHQKRSILFHTLGSANIV